MSGGGPKKPSFTFDKFVMEILKPNFFGFMRFVHKIALFSIFLGLIGYTLYQLEKKDINILDMIFQTESIRLPVDR